METIKVIDLLNKIANGEYPTIKDGINKYEYDKDENDYITGMGYNYEHYFSNINILDYLNDEVEIIEDTPKEDKKIDKLKYCMVDGYIVIGGTRDIDEQLRIICERINEIIDKVNGE